MGTVIETNGLTKEYSGVFGTQKMLALDSLTMEVEQGEIFGFLGPNGAGKTTTIKLLLGIIFPTRGQARLMGNRVTSMKAKKKVGYLPEGSYYHEFLKGEEVLSFYGHLYGMRGSELGRRITESLEMVGLSHARKIQVKAYSKGMRQRIGLAQALLSNPDVLIMDEPTQGLDPIARREIRDVLVKLRDEQGKTLFVCSHELSEVEMICDRVIILNKGRIVQSGKLSDLILSAGNFEVTARDLPDDFEQALSGNGDFKVSEIRGSEWVITVPMTKEARQRIVEMIDSRGGELISIRPAKDSLEDLFLKAVRGETQSS